MEGFGRKRKFEPSANLDERGVEATRVPRAPAQGFREVNQQKDLNEISFEDVLRLFYSPLKHTFCDLPDGHFRLLYLNPGKPDEPLELDLIAQPFNNPIEYIALSYEWGSGPALSRVTVRDYTLASKDRCPDKKSRLRFCLLREVGTKFRIRRNLYNALKQFRHPEETLPLWVDAICINQNNSAEKTAQIKRMADIYNQASDVRIWLGGASDNSPKGMQFVKDLVQFHKLQKLLATENTLYQWDPLIEVMRSRWFSRRWVIQELAFSRRASVWCGEEKVDWDDFADAVSVFKAELPKINESFKSKEGEIARPKALDIIEAYGAYVLIKEVADLLKQDRDGKVLEKKRTIEELVSSFTAFDAGDPRDIIYATTSLARPHGRDAVATALEADYDRSLLDTYVNFMIYSTRSTSRIDIICRHWAPARTNLITEARRANSAWSFVDILDVENTLPSWIKRLDESPFGTPDEIYRGRKYGDAFATIRPTYNASGRYDANEPAFGTLPQPNDIATDRIVGDRVVETITVLSEHFDGTMRVRGLVLGQIQKVSGRVMPEWITSEVFRMGGLEYPHVRKALPVEVVPDQLWRTLIANRGSNGEPPAISYRRSLLYALQRDTPSGDVHIGELIRSPDTPTVIVQYLQRVRDVMWNRQAFLAGCDNELYGICSPKAKENDYVCILYGCSVPVILHKERDMPWCGQRLKLPQEKHKQRSYTRQTSAALSGTASEAVARTVRLPGAPPTLTTTPTTTLRPRVATSGQRGRPSRRGRGPTRRGGGTKRGGGVGNTSGNAAVNPQRPLVEPQYTSRSYNTLDFRNHSQPPADEAGEAREYFSLVGECYVDGKMEGEAIGICHTERDFTLV